MTKAKHNNPMTNKPSRRWEYQGDSDPLGYGGTWCKRTGDGRFMFVVLENTEEWIGGEDWRGKVGFHYWVGVKYVDLGVVPLKEQVSAMRSCCGDDAADQMAINDYDEQPRLAMIADACQSYGAYAIIAELTGDNGHKIIRQAKRSANEHAADADLLSSALNKTVNDIGSTALEMMRGNVTSAISRGVLAGDQNAAIVAKMYGATQEAIDGARPEDWLPYLSGYMDATNDSTAIEDDDLSPEYNLGYKRGIAVKEGRANKPSWIHTDEGDDNASS